MSDKTYVLYAASYASKQDALDDLKALKEIKSAGEIRDLTAAVVSKKDLSLTRASKKAIRAIDKGDVSAAVTDLEKGLDKAANIAGE